MSVVSGPFFFFFSPVLSLLLSLLFDIDIFDIDNDELMTALMVQALMMTISILEARETSILHYRTESTANTSPREGQKIHVANW